MTLNENLPTEEQLMRRLETAMTVLTETFSEYVPAQKAFEDAMKKRPPTTPEMIDVYFAYIQALTSYKLAHQDYESAYRRIAVLDISKWGRNS